MNRIPPISLCKKPFTFKRFFVNILCAFIPIKKLRHSIRDYSNQYENLQNKKYNILLGAITDFNGLGMLEAMIYNAGIPEKYKHIFYQIQDNDVCIDCGANVGLISDIILKFGGICYAFEPSTGANRILERKYKGNSKIQLISKAVSDSNGKAVFNTNSAFDQGASIMNKKITTSSYEVEVIRLVDFMQILLKKYASIYLLKLDVEGVEFDILKDIIDSGIYKNIKYIVCETHERLYEELKPNLKCIKDLIFQNNIDNIYLDWI